MNSRQFRLVIILFCLLILGQSIQTALLLRAQKLTQQTAESAEMAAIDTLELAKREGTKQKHEGSSSDDVERQLLSARGRAHRQREKKLRHDL